MFGKIWFDLREYLTMAEFPSWSCLKKYLCSLNWIFYFILDYSYYFLLQLSLFNPYIGDFSSILICYWHDYGNIVHQILNYYCIEWFVWFILLFKSNKKCCYYEVTCYSIVWQTQQVLIWNKWFSARISYHKYF